MDFVLTIAAKIGEYLVAPIGRQIGYLLCYTCNIEEFRKEHQSLKDIRDGVQQRVDVAKNNNEVIFRNVEAFLTDVDLITEDTTDLLGADVNKGCVHGLNLKSRHQRSRRATKKTKDADQLKEGGNKILGLAIISVPAPPPTIGSTSNEEVGIFESRKLTYLRIMEAVKDDNINMIGIFGMGGVGKTTMVNEVAKQAKVDNLFDEIVKGVASQDSNIEKIQDEIADMLGLELKEKSVRGRAGRLFQRLEKKLNGEIETEGSLARKGRILVILDDIWSKVNLEEIGIPFGSKHQGCKVLITSRSQDVCSQMGTRKNFHIEALSELEGWNMFKTILDSVRSSYPDPLASEVAKECGGLPIAIVAVASALRHKSMAEWEDAANKLRRSNLDDNVFSCLKLSYDYLGREAQQLFLHCCLFPEDSDIKIQDLLKYGMGLGVFEDVDTLEEATVRTQALAATLRASSLLQDGSGGGSVKMHDVVRDFAIKTASRKKALMSASSSTEQKDKQLFLVRNKWLSEQTFQEPYTAISLSSCAIDKLPDGLKFPMLQMLVLHSSDRRLRFPRNFFSEMKSLKVLIMSGIDFMWLPESLPHLENLRTLCFHGCSFPYHMPTIGEMGNIEILSFAGSVLESLPTEIGMLTSLRVLDLSGCQKLHTILPNIIGRLSKLEGLYLHEFPESLMAPAELKQLPNLTTLELRMEDERHWPEDLIVNHLSQFKISIGTTRPFSNWVDFPLARMLKLSLDTSTPLKNGVMELLKTAEVLLLIGVKNLQSVPPVCLTLRRLFVVECDEVEDVFNSTNIFSPTAFCVLETLFLSELPNLIDICHGQLPPFGFFCELQELTLEKLPMLTCTWEGSAPEILSFRKLRRVLVQDCPKLKNLFSHSIAKDLPELVTLEVKSCELVQEIFGKEREEETTDTIVFPSLRSLELSDLQNFIGFSSKMKCHTEGILFHEKVAIPSLENLKIYGLPNFKQIWTHGAVRLRELKLGNLQNLCSISISKCQNLTHLFSPSMARGLVRLQNLEIEECGMMKDIFMEQSEGELEAIGKFVFPQLQTLKLRDLPLTTFFPGMGIVFPQLHVLRLQHLPSFTTFCHGGYSEADLGISMQPLFNEKVEFPNLEILEIGYIENFQVIFHDQLPDESFCQLRELEIAGCHKLLGIAKSKILRRLKNLNKLEVQNCDLMEEIFELEDFVPEGIAATSFVQLKQVKLNSLPKLRIFCLGNHNFNFSSLETMSLAECPMMDKFSSGLISTPKLNRMTFSYLRKTVEGSTLWKHRDILGDRKRWKGDINATMKYLFQEMLDSSRVLVIQDAGDLNLMLRVRADNYSTLKKLKVRSCHEVSTVFPFNFLQSLQCLEVLYVERGYSVEEVFEVEGHVDEGIVTAGMFELLEKLRLRNLPKLKHIWWDKYPNRSPGFQNLCQVIIFKCDSLESLFPSSIACSLGRLRVLSIESCLTMKTIIAVKEREGEEIGMDITVVFPQLHTLYLDSLPNMASFYTGSFRETQPLFDNKVVFLNLEILHIRYIKNLQTIFHNQLPDESFGQLKELQVTRCRKLLNIGKSNILPRLKNLKELHIEYCDLMEEIFELEEHVAEGIDSTSFSQLRQVKLHDLPKLKTFCSGNHSFEFSSLEILKLDGCPLMDKFSSGLERQPQ